MLRVLVYVLVLAAIIYTVFWAIGRRNDGTQGGGGGLGPLGPRRPQPPRGPVGPDDDEDFLRRLDWERQRDAHRQRKRDQEGGTTDPGDPPPAPTG